MAKAPPPPPPTEAQINQAAGSGFMRDLVAVAEAFGRAGVNAPFTVALPQLVQGWVKDKNGYRKIAIKAGAQFDIDRISMGKKAGLLFCFKPVGGPVADKDNPEWIELNWDDVINAFGDLADDVDNRFGATGLYGATAEVKTVAQINERLKTTIAANPSMHKILMAGFERAFSSAKLNAHEDQLASIPGFGMF